MFLLATLSHISSSNRHICDKEWGIIQIYEIYNKYSKKIYTVTNNTSQSLIEICEQLIVK